MAILLSLPATTTKTAEWTAAIDSPPQGMTGLTVDVNVNAYSGTSPTMDVYVERVNPDQVWYQVAHMTQITGAVGNTSLLVAPDAATTPGMLTGQMRIRGKMGGTTPSFTFSLTVNAR
jgi:hypothetical protein